MATKTESAEIAVLQTQMKSVMEGVGRIEEKLDIQTSLFVTKVEYNEFKKRWLLSHTMSAFAGSVITALTIYIITQGIK